MNTWFKNITAYRLRARIAVLHDMLADYPFTPCPPSEMSRMGWVDPFGTLGDGSLVRFVNGSLVIKLKREERVLPPYVVNEHLGNRIRVIESEQM